MGKAKISGESEAESVAQLPFEVAIEELEQIVHEMESERLPLETLVESYERGHRLLKACQSRIDEAEQRIERIAAGVGSGEVELQPFEAAAESEPAPAAAEPAPTRATPQKRRAAAPQDDDEIRLF